MTTTLWMRVDDADNGHSESYELYLTEANCGGGAYGERGASPIVQMTGRYADTFRRTSSGWKLSTRTILQGVN